jgi:hypothetical protein
MPAFHRVVQADAGGIMCSYNAIVREHHSHNNNHSHNKLLHYCITQSHSLTALQA